MSVWSSPKLLLKKILSMGQLQEYPQSQLTKDKAAIKYELVRLPANCRTSVKAKLIQITRDMRNLKMTVRRLTQTEITPNDAKSGKLNDSLIDSLAPLQTIMYKHLIVEYEIDEAVAAFACLQTNFR